MYLSECRKRRADRVDRARKWEKRTVAEIVAEMVHSERAAEVLHQWINTNRMEFHRPPPVTLGDLITNTTMPTVPGTVRYRLINFPYQESVHEIARLLEVGGGQAPLASNFWVGPYASIRNTIRGQSGLERPNDRPLSWGYLQ